MSETLSIMGIQADLAWENPIENIQNFETKINEFDKAVDIIVLPEMFTSGFTMQPNHVAESMNGTTVLWMQNIAKEKQLAITGSLVIKENGNYYNRLLFVQPSGKIDYYDKRHSFTLAGEHKAYTSGNKKIIIDYKGWKICPLICYDLRFPVWARNTESYDLLIYMANWPITRIKAWETLLKARAIENMCYTIGVNRIGIDANDYKYSGNSIIVDFLGEEISNLQPNKYGFIYFTLNKKEQNKVRNKLGFLNDRDTFKIDY